MQKRLYEMEITPPVTVWEKLSVTIDEINDDNRLGRKIMDAELTPPFSVWEKINSTINVVEKNQVEKRKPVINLRRIALAAILIGVMATGWIVFQNINQKPSGVAEISPGSTEKKGANEPDSTRGKNENGINNSPTDVSTPANGSIATVEIKNTLPVNSRNNSQYKNRNARTARSSPVQYAALNTPRAKSFNRSIDDLSLVTSDQHYLTMVNSNGRLVKIPAQLVSLAPHLQDKPISEDIYEVMFGEGTYWKETLTEWRKKVASVPVASGDAFTSFIELLKSVQDK